MDGVMAGAYPDLEGKEAYTLVAVKDIIHSLAVLVDGSAFISIHRGPGGEAAPELLTKENEVVALHWDPETSRLNALQGEVYWPSLADVGDSRWYEWDDEQEEWSFRKAEDHVFAEYDSDFARRIGDMDREELLYVIAVGYQERDDLARAIAGNVTGRAVDSNTVHLAQLIMKHLASPVPYEKHASPGGVALIASERARQMREGWAAGHDDEHDRHELVKAAAAYALHAGKIMVGVNYDENGIPKMWPFEADLTGCCAPKPGKRANVHPGSHRLLQKQAGDHRPGRRTLHRPPFPGSTGLRPESPGAGRSHPRAFGQARPGLD